MKGVVSIMINLEWRRRINHWRNTLPSLFYTPAGELEFSGFATKEQLDSSEAIKRKFKKMPTGTAWGAKWEYGWFKSSLTIPASLAGKRIAMRIAVGGEAAISINGVNYGANDIGHKEITLSHKARGGEKYDILVESYAGHGPRILTCGPVPCGEASVPEPPAAQVEVKKSTFGVWNEEIYQLWVDMETLMLFREHARDSESLRVAEVDDALKELTLIVDLELPWNELLKSVKSGRKLLQKVLACKNGSTSALMTCFGHSHIDVAWLWPLQETERKCCRTFSSQLALMAEYPEYKYLQSQPHVYNMVKHRYPALYERIKKAIQSGQWIAEGGMWVEADTNISGGESLIRQLIHGKRFFKEEFGVENELLWLPDVFGYSGALPQIMKECGIKYFSTQKIFWTYNGGDPFPYNIFWWEGIDGTKILSYLHNDYNSQTTPQAVIQRWEERVQKDSVHNSRLFPFGYGDGGGGPTRDHLEFLRRERNFEGMPRCEINEPNSYFEALPKEKLPVWVGELYFQGHRGTYTAQAKTKKGNRFSEIALREAEMWGAAASVSAKFKYPLDELDSLWKDVLLNQFHDIIPGSSIQRVYEEAESAYSNVIKKAKEIASEARNTFVKHTRDTVTVFNSLSWKRDAVIEVPQNFEAVKLVSGEILPVQEFAGKKYAAVKNIPAAGWTTIKNSAPVKCRGSLNATANMLENQFMKLTLNESGEITSIFDKENGCELADGACNNFKLYKDVPGAYDAWDIDSIYIMQPVDLSRKARLTLVASGPLFAIIRVERQINKSSLVQEIVMYAQSRRIDFRTRVEWNESHKLLKELLRNNLFI